MNISIFGVLKRKQGKQGKQGKLYDEVIRACRGRAWTKADAVRTIIEAWGRCDHRCRCGQEGVATRLRGGRGCLTREGCGEAEGADRSRQDQ
jgi:hypothetical protein